MGVTRRSDVRGFNQGSEGLILQSDIVQVGPPTRTIADSLGPISAKRTYIGGAPITETSRWSGKTVQCVGVVRSVPEVDLETGCNLLLKGDVCEHESDTNRIVSWGDRR
jgi:hypothetical protein